MCLTLQLGEFGSVPSKILKILRFDSFVHRLANPKPAVAKNGDDDYSIRHIGKEGLLCTGTLPTRIVVSALEIHTYNLLHGPVNCHGHVDQVDNDNDGNFNGHAAQEEENMQMSDSKTGD